MKKTILKLNAYLAMVMLCFALISCGGSDSGSDSEPPPIKSASQLTQSDFNVANAKSLSEAEFRAESSGNDSFKNMDDSMEANPQNEVNDNSVSSRFSLSSAEPESYEECFDRKTSIATFQPSEKGGFKAALGNTEIRECLSYSTPDISIIYSFAYDQVKVRDSEGAEVNLEGKTLGELFDPSNNYNPAQFNIREHIYASGYGITSSFMISANSSADFNNPCVVSADNQVSGCAMQIAERVSSPYEDDYNNKELLKINTVTANPQDEYFTNGTVDFVINDWEGVMTYDGDGSTPPTYTATSAKTEQTISGTYGDGNMY